MQRLRSLSSSLLANVRSNRIGEGRNLRRSVAGSFAARWLKWRTLFEAIHHSRQYRNCSDKTRLRQKPRDAVVAGARAGIRDDKTAAAPKRALRRCVSAYPALCTI
jgi:hypothetical protein